MSAIAAKTSFTDLFIRRPVLAIVINLIIIAVGWRAISSLPVRQYPRIESSSIIITTAYMSIEPQLKVLDLPHSGYIVKPFRLDELGARIDAVL